MTGVRVVRGEVRGVLLLFMEEEATTVVEGGGARLMIARVRKREGR